MNLKQVLGTAGTIILLGVMLSIFLSLPVMWLWNGCLVPAINGVNEIGWLQAWGLSILVGLLFKTSVSGKGS